MARELEDDAENDDDLARVLGGTDGDPDRIRDNVCTCMHACMYMR